LKFFNNNKKTFPPFNCKHVLDVAEIIERIKLFNDSSPGEEYSQEFQRRASGEFYSW